MTAVAEIQHDPEATPVEAAQERLAPALLLTLGLLSAFAPFAMGLYLPAFPAMTTDLGASATGVQLTLTAFLIGAGVGQLDFGPLSDRFGRRRPLLVGAVVSVLASVLAALAPSIGLLVGLRLLQGLAGASSPPSPRSRWWSSCSSCGRRTHRSNARSSEPRARRVSRQG